MHKTQEKIVYFAGAIRGERVAQMAMRELIEYIQTLPVKLATEHIGLPDPDSVFSNVYKKTRAEVTDADIEQQDRAWIAPVTHFIAEVTGASTGTGIEIEYARTKRELGGVPAKVLCLYDKNKEAQVSAMVRGMTSDRYPNVTVRAYSDPEEAKQIVTEFLRS